MTEQSKAEFHECFSRSPRSFVSMGSTQQNIDSEQTPATPHSTTSIKFSCLFLPPILTLKSGTTFHFTHDPRRLLGYKLVENQILVQFRNWFIPIISLQLIQLALTNHSKCCYDQLNITPYTIPCMPVYFSSRQYNGMR